MKTLMQWLRLHPIKAVLFTMLFTAIATSAGFREDFLVKLIIAQVSVILVWCGIAAFDMRKDKNKIGIGPKLMVVFLASVFVFNPSNNAAPPPPPKQQQNAVGIAAGVVVICIGSYCVYRVVKFCQKKFPKHDTRTNSEPDSLTFNGNAGSDEYGGSYSFTSIGSCADEDGNRLQAVPDENSPPFTANLKVVVDEFGGVTSTLAASQDIDGSDSQSWSEFQAEVASHGLVMSGQGDGVQHFERGRQPCASELVPFSFDPFTHAVVHRGTVGRIRTVTVERSSDFTHWFPLITINSTFDAGFQVTDLTRQGQMFYRCTVQ